MTCPKLCFGTEVCRHLSGSFLCLLHLGHSVSYLFSLGAWKSLEKEGGEGTGVSEED